MLKELIAIHTYCNNIQARCLWQSGIQALPSEHCPNHCSASTGHSNQRLMLLRCRQARLAQISTIFCSAIWIVRTRSKVIVIHIINNEDWKDNDNNISECRHTCISHLLNCWLNPEGKLQMFREDLYVSCCLLYFISLRIREDHIHTSKSYSQKRLMLLCFLIKQVFEFLRGNIINTLKCN